MKPFIHQKMEKVKSWKCSRILCNRVYYVSTLRKLSSILAQSVHLYTNCQFRPWHSWRKKKW